MRSFLSPLSIILIFIGPCAWSVTLSLNRSHLLVPLDTQEWKETQFVQALSKTPFESILVHKTNSKRKRVFTNYFNESKNQDPCSQSEVKKLSAVSGSVIRLKNAAGWKCLLKVQGTAPQLIAVKSKYFPFKGNQGFSQIIVVIEENPGSESEFRRWLSTIQEMKRVGSK